MTCKAWLFAIGLVFYALLGIADGRAQTQPSSTQTNSTVLPPVGEPIGNVATVSGSATLSRFGNATALKVDDDIYLGDTLQTGADSALGITFNDATTFNLSANSSIVVNNFVYEDGGKKNSALFNVARGTVAFVASAVAKTGDMKISTPTATLGIRGTTGVIEVPDNVAPGGNEVAVKLYPDQDGRVGRIEVHGRDGVRLGLLSQAASGFAIRHGAGGRFTAAPLRISAQQATRDRGFVRQLHAAQGIGRQIVTRQRALRQQNLSRQPGLQRPNMQRPDLQRQPGQQRPPNLQRQPGPPKTPGAARPPGAAPQPGARPAASPKLPASPRLPGAPKPPGQRSDAPHPPGMQRPVATPRPLAVQRGPSLQRAPQTQPGRSPLPARGTKPPKENR